MAKEKIAPKRGSSAVKARSASTNSPGARQEQDLIRSQLLSNEGSSPQRGLMSSRGPVQTPQGQPPQGQPPMQGRGGSVQQAVSGGLMQLGFDLLGSAVGEMTGTPQPYGGMQPNQAAAQGVSNIGRDINNVIQNRFWAKEFEDFTESVGKPWQSDLQTVQNLLDQNLDNLNTGMFIGPSGEPVNPSSEESVFLRRNWERDALMATQRRTDQLLGDAEKWGTNPMVRNWTMNMMQRQTQIVGQMLNPQMTTQGAQSVAEVAKTRAEEQGQLAGRGGGKGLDRSKMNIDELVDSFEGSLIKTRAFLMGNKIGREILAPQIAQTTQRYVDNLISENEDLKGRPDAIQEMVKENIVDITNQAAWDFMSNGLPYRRDELEGIARDMPEFVPLRRQEAEPDIPRENQITRTLSKAQREAHTNAILNKVIDLIGDHALETGPDSLQESIDYVLSERLPEILNTHGPDRHGNKIVQKELEKIRGDVISKLSEGGQVGGLFDSDVVKQYARLFEPTPSPPGERQEVARQRKETAAAMREKYIKQFGRKREGIWNEELLKSIGTPHY